MSTFTSEAYSDEGAEALQNCAAPGYQHTADLPNYPDHPLTKPDAQDYSPYDGSLPKEYRPMEYPSNVYSGIGSQFQPVGTQVLEKKFFMEPVLSQDLLMNPYNNSNVTISTQIAFEDHLQPLIPNFAPDRPAPPAVPTATAYANIASYDAFSRYTGQAVTPIHATPWMASTSDYSSTDPTTLSTYSSNFASVDTSHFNGSSNLIIPYYSVTLGSAGTHNSAQVPVALPSYAGISNSMPGTEEPSNSKSASHRPGHRKTLKPK